MDNNTENIDNINYNNDDNMELENTIDSPILVNNLQLDSLVKPLKINMKLNVCGLNYTLYNFDGTNKSVFENVETLIIDDTWDLDDIGFYSRNTNIFNPIFNYFVNIKKITIKNISLLFLPDFSKFDNLEYLVLHNIDMEIQLFNFPEKLKLLELSKCKIKELPLKLFNLHKLESLYLGNNKISNLPKEIANLQKLHSLDLSNNLIEELPDEFGQLNISRLNLNNNNLHTIKPSFFDLTKITRLLMNNCRIYNLYDGFAKLVNLEALDIGNNDNILSFPNSLFQCIKLNNCNMEKCNITDHDITDEFYNLINLERIRLSNNYIKTISHHITKLTKLIYFNISYNYIENLPLEIGFLSNLESLILKYNNLIEIPSTLSALVKLKNLNLEGNELFTLPDIFNNLS